MIRLENDYNRGAHPMVLEALVQTNDLQAPGYGVDDLCAKAAEKIRIACDRADADVHFLMGGTQTNLTVIKSILRPHEAVVAPVSGHIAVAETGAIEAGGNKVITLPSCKGKITAEQLYEVFNKPENIHSPKPGMIFISQSTEVGTVYQKTELLAIKKVAEEFDVPLYIDGARLGYGLTSEESDVTLADIAQIADAFYIGGTKQGAMFGEAVVICHDRLKKDFRYIMKQRGALLAKGRLLGVQFDALFTDGLYFEISEYANATAKKIEAAFADAGIPIVYPVETNQIFFELTDAQFEKLGDKFSFAMWGKRESTTVYRICTDWGTKQQDVEQLITDIKSL